MYAYAHVTKPESDRASFLHPRLCDDQDLAKILTLENGKPLAEARGELGYAAR